MAPAPRSGPDSGLGLFSILAKITNAIAGICLCGLVAVLVWQVIGRYVLNDSPGWTEPLALVFVSIAALFGAALAVRSETHFAFPLLVELSPAPIKLLLKFMARFISFAFGAALAFYGGLLVADGWDVSMAGAPLPEGFAFVGICSGGAMIAVFAFERLLKGDAPAEPDPVLGDAEPAATPAGDA
jgi:TRAP-type C4-dicarboxylate transport system permease small subunit